MLLIDEDKRGRVVAQHVHGSRSCEGYVDGARVVVDAGGYFAELARVEAAAVHSFTRLARELEAHCAPRALVKRVRLAASDERRHASAMKKMASRFGSRVELAHLPAENIRDLFTIARENAAFGCIRETYAALLAHEQARAAEDLRVRAMMKRIAKDETRHALLAWDIWRFCELMLPREARDSIRKAADCEARALRKELGATPPLELARTVGLPNATRAQAMLDGMLTALFVTCELAA